MTAELIPFKIETQRIVELLAKQIYQSPLALLRENTQNAFDAIRMRLHIQSDFSPRIEIEITPEKIVVSDNGIGMTREDLSRHFWSAGSSSKNNPEARAAGVVGTFGIGAMANFGIANILEVVTEHAVSGTRTRSTGKLEELSVTENCIPLEGIASEGKPGTQVVAYLRPGTNLDVNQATNYISEFVSLVDVPVTVNGQIVSQKDITALVPVVPESHKIELSAQKLGNRLKADAVVVISNNADVWISLNSIVWNDAPLVGRIVARSGMNAFRTFRSGFGLANSSVSSFYQLGGICDLRILEPTAGREAITSEGVQLLQSIASELDAFLSLLLSDKSECDSSTYFMNWIVAHGRYEMCDMLKVNITPGDRTRLGDIKAKTQIKPLPLYNGQDQTIIKQYASEDAPLILLARSNPRHQIETQYLAQFCKTESVSDTPKIVHYKERALWSSSELALVFRLETILESDYFLKSSIVFGSLSHGLHLLVEKFEDGVKIVIDPLGPSTTTMLGLYENEYNAFASMVKDYVRSVIFPRVSDYVPSATRQGAEAFLNAIKRTREYVEYDDTDTDSLATILEDYKEGRIEFPQAIEMWKLSSQSAVQVVDESAMRDARSVVPDVFDNEALLSKEQDATPSAADKLDAAPAILRQEISSPARLLVIADSEPALRGHRCFLAITDNTKRQFGDFFLQPHRTAVIWGGQRTLFVFLHHSGQFGLYYDLLTLDAVNATAGGGHYETATIVLKDRIYIPIPAAISANFVPKSGERKRFEVRADIIRTEENGK
jgi:molecular chaperone HtpG